MMAAVPYRTLLGDYLALSEAVGYRMEMWHIGPCGGHEPRPGLSHLRGHTEQRGNTTTGRSG